MVRRRHALDRAKGKGGRGALQRPPAGERSGLKPPMRPRLGAALLGLLSVVLLSASFTPFEGWFLAYVALAPWAMIFRLGTTRRWELFCAWLAGLVFWAANLYWLWWITLVGYAALVVYLSAYWLVAAVVVRAAMRRRLPMWAVLPVVWVALEYARVYVISGFPWFFLAHSQYARTHLIQIADLTGQYGVSFFVAMVNGAVVDVLISPLLSRRPQGKRVTGRVIFAVSTTLIVGAALVGYGLWRVGQSHRSTRPGPVIGIVQHAFPISLGGRHATPEKILADHIESSLDFTGKQCDLVVWPETMLPTGLNQQILNLDASSLDSRDLRSLGLLVYGPKAEGLSDEILRGELERWIHGAASAGGLAAQARKMGALSRRLGCPILAGGATRHHNVDPIDDRDRWLTRNSALWFDGAWRASAIYSKSHLVPFSEYVPFKRSIPWLHRALRWFVPPVMEQLDPGRSFRPFELIRRGQTWRLASPICYEGTFARVCRKMVVRDGRKQADILVNLSNDGWFVYRRWGKGAYRGSNEHPQHLVQYCFRAVETRTPVVRAVNTGISASIDSNGQIVAELDLTLDDYKKRSMFSGRMLLDGTEKTQEQSNMKHGPRVLVDGRVTVYSLVGDVFAIAVSASGALLAAWLVWRAARPRRKQDEILAKDEK